VAVPAEQAVAELLTLYLKLIDIHAGDDVEGVLVGVMLGDGGHGAELVMKLTPTDTVLLNAQNTNSENGEIFVKISLPLQSLY
jgi:hypothetical protein